MFSDYSENDRKAEASQSNAARAAMRQLGRGIVILAVFQTVVGAALCTGPILYWAGFQSLVGSHPWWLSTITVVGPLLAGLRLFLRCLFCAVGILLAVRVIRFLFHPAVRQYFGGQHVRFQPRPPATDSFALRIGVGSLLACWLFLTLIVAPALLNSWNFRRQCLTWLKIRLVVEGLEGFTDKHGYCPEAETIEDLATLLEPTTGGKLPTTGGWGWPLEYQRVGKKGYVVRSPGSDGWFEQDNPTAYIEGPVRGCDRDLAWGSDSGAQWPASLVGPYLQSTLGP
ncbi:MAG: hypothetical protein GY842_08035 [bacterium]|nr:hypothetical protein [bacterium]